MKKLTIILILCILLVGCKKKNEIDSHNKYDNALKCVAKYDDEESVMYIYFDKQDRATSFDYYFMTSQGSFTEEEIKEKETYTCEGNGNFPKAMIGDCKFEIKDEKIYAHLYITSPLLFGDDISKKTLKKSQEGIMEDFDCKEYEKEA